VHQPDVAVRAVGGDELAAVRTVDGIEAFAAVLACAGVGPYDSAGSVELASVDRSFAADEGLVHSLAGPPPAGLLFQYQGPHDGLQIESPVA